MAEQAAPAVRAGFVGLGNQGAPMAERIVGAGRPLTIYARRPDVVEQFRALGATPATSLRELAAASDMVGICVRDDEQVREVVLGDNLLAGMRPGGILVVHSTVMPATVEELAAVAADRDVALLDAPVSGGQEAARAGELAVFVGGDAGALERCRSVLETFGNPVQHMGRLGTGQMTKILNNYFYAVQLGIAYDMAMLIRQLGFDLDAAAKVFPASSSSSWVFARYAETGFSQLTPTHPKGRDYGLSTLQRIVSQLREIAAANGATLGMSDAVATRALELVEARVRGYS